jgi:pimeloyl-ACP methyl ester carboxylesterase
VLARAAPLLVLVAVLAGCGGSSAPTPREAHGSPAARGGAPARFARPLAPCARLAGFDCTALPVPRDRRTGAGELRLAVAVQRGGAPRGVLLALTGGPGQPGVPFAASYGRRLGAAARGYRIVAVDQRGTGAGALRCPGLQRLAGLSDLALPPPDVEEACAREVGTAARESSTTMDTVADLEALREALGAQRMTLVGTSYGTFTAERYALAHPDRVARLVLDSTVRHDGIDVVGLNLATARRTAAVLRAACAEARCPSDPVADLRTVGRARSDDWRLFEAVAALSVVDPDFRGLLGPLRAAAGGRPAALDALLRHFRAAVRVPASALSQGLHEATLCSDGPFPWGSPAAPPAARRGALARTRAALAGEDLGPWEPGALLAIAQRCARWPPVRVPAPRLPARLPAVPTLILAGGRDLSTPLELARWELAHAAGAALVVEPRSGHDVLANPGTTRAHAAVRALLQGGALPSSGR